MLNSKYVTDAKFLALLNSGEELGLECVNIKKYPSFLATSSAQRLVYYLVFSLALI